MPTKFRKGLNTSAVLHPLDMPQETASGMADLKEGLQANLEGIKSSALFSSGISERLAYFIQPCGSDQL